MSKEVSNKELTQPEHAAENSEQKPKGLLRPAGIGALLVLFVVLPICVYLFAGTILKSATITALEHTFKAQTDIESFEITWQPFGVEITNLQQTDAKSPDLNLFQVDKLNAKLELTELLLGNVIVDQLLVSGVQQGQSRTSAGSVYLSEQTQTQQLDQSDPSKKSATKAKPEENSGIEVPSAEEVLAKADLITEQKANNLTAVIEQQNKLLDEALRGLPDDKTIKQYRQQWDQITKGSIKSLDDIDKLKTNLEKLNKTIQQDKRALKTAKQQYSKSKKAIDNAVRELRKAPAQDLKNIKQQYPIDDPSVASVSKMLFGDKAAKYIEQGQEAYEKLKPYIDAYKAEKTVKKPAEETVLSSKKITFTLDNPVPKLLVREFEISYQQDADTYLITGDNLTHQNYVQDQASTFKVQLQGRQDTDLIITGSYYLDQTLTFTAKGNWQSSQPNFSSEGASETVSIESSQLTGKGQFEYNKVLTSNNTLSFNNTKFQGQGGSELNDIMLNTLKNVSQFDVSFALSGELLSPSLSIRSDLDKRLSKGFKKAVKQRWAKFESELKDELNQKAQQSLNLSDSELKDLNKVISDLSSKERSLSQYSQNKVDSWFKQEKKKQQKRLEDKAKKEVDKQKKKLENKLKDKLKDFKCC